MRRTLFLLSIVVLLGSGLWAQNNGRTGFSAERLTRIDRLLQQYVDESRIAGAVALVLQDGQPVYERAFGWSNKEAGRARRTRSDPGLARCCLMADSSWS